MNRITENQSSYLLQLRQEGFKTSKTGWGFSEESMLEVISMQSAFPGEIREVIRTESKQQRLMDFHLTEWATASRRYNREKWAQFKSLVVFGMFLFPKDLGFLFHALKPRPFQTLVLMSERNAFETACVEFGEQVVTSSVKSIVWRMTRGRPYAQRVFLLSAASNPDIVADGLYFLLQIFDPIVLFPSRS